MNELGELWDALFVSVSFSRSLYFSVFLSLFVVLSLLDSGPVGDDDLWYHHIPGTLRSVFLSVFFSVPPLRPPSWL